MSRVRNAQARQLHPRSRPVVGDPQPTRRAEGAALPLPYRVWTDLLAETFTERLGAVEVDRFPEAFEWRDGFDGRELMHVPLMCVHWGDGNATFVDSMHQDDLEADPELGGTRRRVEAECLARGAGYEIWTDTDVACARVAGRRSGPAGRTLRVSYLEALASPPLQGSSIPLSAAQTTGHLDLRELDGNWLGRSALTGIPHLLSSAVPTDPATGLAMRMDRLADVGTFPRRHSRRRAVTAPGRLRALPGRTGQRP